MNIPIRILLADDHVLVRQGLRSLLEREEFQVVAEASDEQEAVRLTQTSRLVSDRKMADGPVSRILCRA